MEGQLPEQARDSLEERSRALFQDSVEGLDFALRSRLTQARNAAIQTAVSPGRPRWFPRFGMLPRSVFSRFGLLMPVGVTAAAVLGAFLWLGSPMGRHAATVADGQPNLEDLEIVASADGSSGDAMDMLQDDIEFYDWADKAANPGPAA